MHSLSIVIPAFNEELRLPGTLERIRNFTDSRPWHFLEVIVVDDGSRDRTAAVVEHSASGWPALRLLKNPGNRGKGYSVRNGMSAGQGDWLLFTDADLSSPIEELDKLLRAAEETGAKVVLGSRALDRRLVSVRQPAVRELSGRFFNRVMRMVTGLPFRDTQCGFKLFQREAARQIFPRQRLDGFGFDVEDLFIAKQLGIRCEEVGVRWANVEGTKVGFSNGLDAFLDLWRVRANGARGLYR